MKQSRLGMKHRKILTSRVTATTSTKTSVTEDSQQSTKRRKLSADGCHFEESTSDSSESELEDVKPTTASVVDDAEDDNLSITTNDGNDSDSSDDSTSDEDDVQQPAKQPTIIPFIYQRKRTHDDFANSNTGRPADAVMFLSSNAAKRRMQRSFAPEDDSETDNEVETNGNDEAISEEDQQDYNESKQDESDSEEALDERNDTVTNNFNVYNDSSSNDDDGDGDDYLNELDEHNLVEPGRV